MLNKFKNLSKKTQIISTVGAVLVVAGVLGLVGYNLGKKDVVVSEETFTKVLGESYNVKITSENEEVINLDIVGEPSDDVIKSLYDLGGNLGKTKLNINFFEKDDMVKNIDKFYVDGLISQVELDYLTKSARVGRFETVTNVEKAKEMADYNGEKLSFENKTVNLSLNMDLTEGNKEEAVAQSKAYIVMFRDLNKDKDISSVQMNINDGKDVSYSYSSEFEDLVKEVKTTHF